MTNRFRIFVTLAVALSGGRLLPAQTAKQDFWFDTGRPLAKAAEELEKTYGWIVTYEDVPVYGADTLDVTGETRADHDAKARVRNIVPNGLPFAFSVDNAKAKERPAEVLGELLTAYGNNPGKFRVLPDKTVPNAFHLVPYEVRDERGNPRPHTAILDTRITLPAGKRSAYEVLLDLKNALAAASGVNVGIGAGLSPNGLHQIQVEGGAKNETARDVLARFLRSLAPGLRMSWHLLCAPDVCVINVHDVPPVK